jgi:hypothetical protein
LELRLQGQGERTKVAALDEARQPKPIAAAFCNKIGTTRKSRDFRICAAVREIADIKRS